jgi:hypothetical protein
MSADLVRLPRLHTISIRMKLLLRTVTNPDPSGLTVKGVGVRPLACWDCGFETRQAHEHLSLVSVVYCHVEVSASG